MSLHFIRLEIVSPAHIGVSHEKKLLALDYLVRNSIISTIDWESVFSKLNKDEIKKFSQSIMNDNKIEQTKISYVNKFPYFKEDIPYANGCVFDVKTKINTHLRDGQGRVYMPGSSLKGAIISVYYSNYATKNRNKISRGDIDVVFGSQENSPLRLFEVTDAYFHTGSTKIYPAKIYSLRVSRINDYEGGWKHKKQGSTLKFNNTDFINLYECFDIGKQGYLRIKFNEELLELNRQQKVSLSNEKIIFDGTNQPIERMFKLINEHTINYLKKELNFFLKFQGERSDNIIKKINVLIELVNQCMKNNCALLHLGSGSGFHGITGDWRFDSHII
ncbi:MAG: RAMP superfamily CRISPR-associated protein, partial [Thermoplasmata archaeon]